MEEHGQFCDVCIVCAMYEEAQAVLDEFSMRCNVSFTKAFSRRDRYEYRRTTIRNIHNEPLTVLVTWPSDRGPVQTGLDLEPFLDEFRPRFAGRLRNQLLLRIAIHSLPPLRNSSEVVGV